MPIKVCESLRVIANHRIQIQRLRVRQVGIRHRLRRRRPIRRLPPPKARRVIPRPKIVVPRFLIPLLPLELVILRARARVLSLPSKRIKVPVIARAPRRGRQNHPRRPQHILRIIRYRARARVTMRNPPPAQENQLIRNIPRRIRLIQNRRPRGQPLSTCRGLAVAFALRVMASAIT